MKIFQRSQKILIEDLRKIFFVKGFKKIFGNQRNTIVRKKISKLRITNCENFQQGKHFNNLEYVA